MQAYAFEDGSKKNVHGVSIFATIGNLDIEAEETIEEQIINREQRE